MKKKIIDNIIKIKYPVNKHSFDEESKKEIEEYKKTLEKNNLKTLEAINNTIIIEEQEKKVYLKEEAELKTETILLLQIKERREATEGITKKILKNKIIKTIRQDHEPEMWIYQEGIYKPEAKSYIKEYCRSILGKAYTTTLANEVIAKIEAETYIEQEEFFNKQNAHPYVLPVQNGLLNIKTKKISPFSHKIPYFNKLSMKYHPESKCPKIINFIESITKNKEDVLLIQEMFGYSLLKEYKHEKSFMLYGSHGRNGKSKLLMLQEKLVGKENVANISLQTLEQDKFSICNLHNKLVNISGDISDEAIRNAGIFKGLTGRDEHYADRKFKSPLKFINYAKMIFSANNLPPVNEGDAFWLRWIIIEFPFQFLPQIELDARKEVPTLKLQNPQIIAQIATNEELEGLLVWSLIGFERLEKNKDFSTNKTASMIKTEWMRKSNSVGAFILDHVNVSYGSKILKQDFKQKYLDYCIKHRLKTVSDKVIKITLENECSAISKKENYFDETTKQYISKYYWEGINFKEESHSLDSLDRLGFPTYREKQNSPIGSNTLTILPTQTITSKRIFDYFGMGTVIFYKDLQKHFNLNDENDNHLKVVLDKMLINGDIFKNNNELRLNK